MKCFKDETAVVPGITEEAGAKSYIRALKKLKTILAAMPGTLEGFFTLSIPDSGKYDLLDQLAKEFAARLRRGERPALKEYTDHYPELAEEIRELFPAMVRGEQAEGVGPDGEEDRQEAGHSPAADPSLLRQIGDYRILREIGRGGMGVVYEAEQVSLRRRVALKVLPGQVSRDWLVQKRFRREARAAARLHHTNIVPVYDVGQDGDVWYYAMQFIEGQGLDAVITELRRLLDRARSLSKMGAASGGRTLWRSGEQPRRGIEAPTLGEGVEVSLVLQYILTGRFDPGSQRPELVVPTQAMESGAQAGDLATPTGTESRWHGTYAALTSTKIGSATAGDMNGLQRAHPSALALPLSASPSSSSAILPGGAQLSSVESGRRGVFRGLAQIGRQVAGGLAYAHARGIVHRDIKPSNLLLDTEAVVWIADFGLAKGEDEGLTHTGDILGTLRYMAPERFRGEGDARADIYALGMTLYELLTLRPGFDSPDRLKLIEQIKTEEPVRPRAIDARIPRDLETIVLKAIEKDPKARYQSAQAMGEDLSRFLADVPIRARQVYAAERYWRWARRNPEIAVLGGVLTGVLVAVAVGSTVAASHFRGLAAVAIEAQQQATLDRDKAQREQKAERWGRYRSNIAAASAGLQLQNSVTARSALEDAPQEQRNWEWHHLHSQLDGASLVLSVSDGKIESLVLSPAGRQVAVCSFDLNEVYLYDVATGKTDAVLRGHSAPATSVAYRPDGKQVATAGNDQTIRLWDPATGQQTALLKAEVGPSKLERNPLVTYNSDGNRIASNKLERNPLVAYNSDGSRIASYSSLGAGTSRLWDATTGKEVAVLAKWQEGSPLDFSPDGKQVAVGSGEYVYLCDAVTGRRLAVLGPRASMVHLLAYSLDGKRIASATPGEDANAIHLWDGESGKEVAVLRGHTASVTSVLFSPDGSLLLSGSQYPDNTARLWDAATGRSLFVLAGHKNEINTVTFSPDGKRVATSSADQTARLWDVRTGELLADLRGHTDRVRHVLFSRNGTRVVTASEDATLRYWNAQTGELIGVSRGHGDGFAASPVFTPDGSRLVSGSADGTVRIWDMGLAERNGILSGHTSYVYDVAFSPNGAQVASAAWDGTARLWDATTGRQTDLLKHETEIINSVAYRRDGRQLATMERARGVTLWDVSSLKAARDWHVPLADWDSRASLNPAGTLLAAAAVEGPVQLWDVATRREVARLEGHDEEPKDTAFHPDGSLLATTERDGTVRLWNVAARAPVAFLRGHTGIVWRVAFSADGKLLASGSNDKTIRLWDVQTHEQLAVIPMGSIVYGVAFSPDGTRLAAGCRDNTVRLIDVTRRQQVAELRGHTDYVHAVDWSPDGTRLVSGSGDFTVRVWDSLSAQERAKRTADKPTPR